MLTNSAEIGGLCLNFQQDNAPIHIGKTAVKWFLYNGVHMINTFFRLKLHGKTYEEYWQELYSHSGKQ